MKPLLEILQSSEKYLAQRGFPSPRVDAEWLIAHVLKLERLQLYVQFERPMREDELAELRPLLRRRGEGEPLQYIIGSTGFFNCDLEVGPGVLVPRPETERLVELALKRYQEGPILDLCTGSGAILFALSGELTAPPSMIGVDASDEALSWARRNADKLGYSHIDFRRGDLCEPVTETGFGLITANPPYVTEAEFESLPVDVRNHEPREALVAADEGLAIVRRIAEAGRSYLQPGAWLVMEIGERQGKAVLDLLASAGWQEVAILEDYNHRDRVAVGRC